MVAHSGPHVRHLAVVARPYVGGMRRHDGDPVALHGCELQRIDGATLVDVDHRRDVTLHEAMLGQIPHPNDLIVLLDDFSLW